MGKLRIVSVGNDEVDSSNEFLLRHLRRYVRKLAREQDPEKRFLITDSATSFTLRHLSAEEGRMRAVGYPDLSSHQDSHALYTSGVVELLKGIRDGKTTVEETFSSLWIFFSCHVALFDRHYARFATGEELHVFAAADQEGK